MPIAIDDKLTNSTETLPLVRKFILKNQVKSKKKLFDDSHHSHRGTSRFLHEQCQHRQLGLVRNVAQSKDSFIPRLTQLSPGKKFKIGGQKLLGINLLLGRTFKKV